MYLLSKNNPKRMNPQRSPRVFRKAGKKDLEVIALMGAKIQKFYG
jgi:hypothetical protein